MLFDGWKKGDVKYCVKFIDPLCSIFRPSMSKKLISSGCPSLDEKSVDKNKSANIKNSLLNQRN